MRLHPDDQARVDRARESGRYTEEQLQRLADNLVDARRRQGAPRAVRRRMDLAGRRPELPR